MQERDLHELEQLFHQALAQEGSDRERFLDDACEGRPQLREKIDRLLRRDDRAEDALPSPVDLIGQEAASLRPGDRFGAYEVLDLLGRGGMGEVWLARRADGAFQRKVALKVMRTSLRPGLAARFEQERQIQAQLEHPGIARLLDAGSGEDGRPFFVLEYVEGEAIDEYCDRSRLTLRERIALFCQVCEAVDHAHRNLVIHRDLKPDNILISRDGHPKLLDFGIARLLDDPGAPPTEGQAMTPQFASPEQHRGEPVTTGSDVYSLGVLLYDLLSGRLPFESEERQASEHSIHDWAPTPPSGLFRRPTSSTSTRWTPLEASRARRSTPDKLHRLMRGDLDVVVQKAMHPTPAERYTSAHELAEDLRNFLARRPILAREGTWPYRAQRFTQRNPALVATGVLLLLALIVGFVTSTRLFLRVDEAWQSDREQRRLAEERLQENDRLTAELGEKALEAERLRRRAEGTLGELREFAYRTLFELFNEVNKLQGSEGALANISRMGLDLLEAVRADARLRPDFMRPLISAYARLGHMQINLPLSEPGIARDAKESMDQAIMQADELLQTDSEDVRNRYAAARAHFARGDVLMQLGIASEGLESYRRCLEILGDLDEPGIVQGPVALRGSALLALGQWDAFRGASEECVELLEQCLEIERDAVKRFPKARHVHWKEIGEAQATLARYSLLADEPEAALDWALEALDSTQHLAGEPEHLRRPFIERARRVHAQCLLALDRVEEAEEIYRDIQRLQSDGPVDPNSRFAALLQSIETGRILEGDDEALRRAKQTRDEVERLCLEDGARPSWRHKGLLAGEQVVEIHLESGAWKNARETLAEHLDAVAAWTEEHPDFPGQRQLRYRSRLLKARVGAAGGSGLDRKECLAKAIDDLRRLEIEVGETAQTWLEDDRLLEHIVGCRRRLEDELSELSQE